MIDASTQDVSGAIGAEVRGRQTRFHGVGIDTRTLPPEALFVALPGDRVDGHDYVQAAHNRGASAALVERFIDSDITQLKCDNAAAAFARLAAHWRRQFDLPVVGITGSNGKTSVKTMLAAIVTQGKRALVTEGNLNNELGVPLTLCRLSKDHDVAVIEMGAGQPGDIAYLAALACPDVALINNAGPAHLERMGSLDGVAKTKGEMLDGLPPEGTAVLNADDPYFDVWVQRAQGRRIVSFGLNAGADVQASGRPTSAGIEVTFRRAVGELTATLHCRGEHNVANAAAAVAAATVLGISDEQITVGLAAYEPVDGRLNVRPMRGGWQLLQDAYNANPASMSAGLKVLAAQSGERWLIMGDMRELGDDAAALHFQVGSEAHRLGIERVFALGELSAHAVAGFNADRGQHFLSVDSLIDALAAAMTDATAMDSNLTCLLKGSRGMQMERVLEGLKRRGVA
ncbi:MAG: UDP-N-acetylmuramoyl-tripeptide--D-alanyl-D-alanine ligase [Lysobacterales bacterium]